MSSAVINKIVMEVPEEEDPCWEDWEEKGGVQETEFADELNTGYVLRPSKMSADQLTYLFDLLDIAYSGSYNENRLQDDLRYVVSLDRNGSVIRFTDFQTEIEERREELGLADERVHDLAEIIQYEGDNEDEVEERMVDFIRRKTQNRG
jgi:hypothetical protein